MWRVLATKGVSSRVSHHSSSPPYFSFCLTLFLSSVSYTHVRNCLSSYCSILSLYLTHTSTKFKWNVIHLQIGSRTSKSFYKYSSDSPDNHKINLQSHTQHCSENSNPSLSLSAEQTSSSSYSVFCPFHAVVIAWVLYGEDRDQDSNHKQQERQRMRE